MEAYNNESKIYNAVSKTRSWISATLGILVTVLGIIVIFFIASLEGTKEIKASNSTGAKIMNKWREENNDYSGYPQEKAEIIEYDGKEYYFVIDEYFEDSDVVRFWHFAYDGGLDYVYKDPKYWVLTMLVLVVSIFVSNINYKTASKSAKQSREFKATLKYYQEKKELVKPYTQYIPAFCLYKNKQSYDDAKQDIIEEAGINYAHYKSKDFDINSLEKWQKKILEKTKEIKVKRIKSSDLLQEQGFNGTTITLLPMSQVEHQRKFVVGGIAQKIITSALSGFVVSFGVVLGNWYLGIVYGFVILLTAISANFIATDYVSNGLRNRFIGKADLLNEMYNIKDTFMTDDKKQDIDLKCVDNGV